MSLLEKAFKNANSDRYFENHKPHLLPCVENHRLLISAFSWAIMSNIMRTHMGIDVSYGDFQMWYRVGWDNHKPELSRVVRKIFEEALTPIKLKSLEEFL